MKKLLALVLVMILSLTALVGCDVKESVGGVIDKVKDTVGGWFGNEPEPDPDDKPAVEYDVAAATEYVKSLYIKDSANTASDYEVVSQVMVAGVKYTVTWTVDNEAVKVVPGELKTTIDVDEKSQTEVAYKLTFVVTAGDGTTGTYSFDRVVPEYKLFTFEQYMAAAEGDTVVVEGIVVAINSKAAGNSRNHLFLADATVTGGYYSYQMEADPVADLGIEIGMTVSVTGPVAPYSGMQEIKGGVATIVDRNKKEVAPVDITELVASGASLKNYVALPVTIKGVTIGAQELETATSQYLFFTIGETTSYLRTYVTDFPTTLKASDKATIDAAHAEKYAWTANVTGILVLYSGAPYLIPMSVDCFEYLELKERTDAEKVDVAIGELNIPSKVFEDTVIELPTAGKAYNNVAITWTAEGAEIVDGKVTLTIGEEDFNVTLKATFTCNEATKDAEFVITVKAPVTEPTRIDAVLDIGKDLTANTEEQYIVEGVITEIKNDKYGNVYIQDQSGKLVYVYGLNDKSGNKYEAMAVKPAVGDFIQVLCNIGNFKGEVQLANAVVVKHIVPNTIPEANAAGSAVSGNNVLSEKEYLVTGTVTEIANTKYGNMYIKDAEGNTLYIYGLYSSTGAVGFEKMDIQPKVGDTVTVYGYATQYNSSPQIKNAKLLSLVIAIVDPAAKVEAEKEALTVVDKVTVDTVITLPATGATFSDVTITWTATGAEIVDGKINVVLTKEEQTITLVATIACEGAESVNKEFTVVVSKKAPMVMTDVTELVVGQAYQIYVPAYGVYFAGTVSSGKIAGTTAVGTPVYVELAEGKTDEYNLYFYNAEGAKKYIDVTGYTTKAYVFNDTPATNWKYDATNGLYNVTITGTNSETGETAYRYIAAYIANGESFSDFRFYTPGTTNSSTALFKIVTCTHEYSTECDTVCDYCGETREATVAHEAEFACSDVCKYCGVKVTPTADHKKTSCTDTACSVCGVAMEAGEHSTNACTDTACAVCGAAVEPKDHKYDNCDDTTCANCDTTREPVAHIYDNECDVDCNVCATTRTAPHVYDNACDGDCNNCDATRTPADHVYDHGCDVDCNVCGNVREGVSHADENNDNICDNCQSELDETGDTPIIDKETTEE